MACQCRRNLPRQQDVYEDDGNEEGALAKSKRTYLTHTDLAIRSRMVYYSLVPNHGLKSHLKSLPEWKKEGLRLNIFLLEEAANMCGLNGQRLSRWYSVSKWAKKNNSPLSLEEFQWIVERYARVDRDTENIRSLVEENLKKNGGRLKFDLNDSNNYRLINPKYKQKCESNKKITYCPCVGLVNPMVYKVMDRAEQMLKKNMTLILTKAETRKFWQI